MFLPITALPWTTVVGNNIGKVRGWVAAAPQDWSSNSADEHAEHRRQAAAASVATPLKIDDIIARVAPYRLEPPVRLYLPHEKQPRWRVRAETQNRPRVRELELDPFTGELAHETPFSEKTTLDKAIHIGIAAHEGQLFGIANQLLGLFTSLGLVTLCISAIVMWWRRRPDGSLGVPAPKIAQFRVTPALWVGIVDVALLLPVLGASLILLWLFGLLAGRFARAARA
jgi:uncharacterized iron-regulated membrane protein